MYEECVFVDGECKFRLLVDLGGVDVYIVYSLYGGLDVSLYDKLFKLFGFIVIVKVYGVWRVSVVVFYFVYVCKDRCI